MSWKKNRTPPVFFRKPYWEYILSRRFSVVIFNHPFLGVCVYRYKFWLKYCIKQYIYTDRYRCQYRLDTSTNMNTNIDI
jgi:hypothetical protein